MMVDVPAEPIYVFVNGILTFPGLSANWTGRAVTWCINRRRFAEKVEYWVGPISRVLGQKYRARKLAKTLWYYLTDTPWRVRLVAHSNGNNVVVNALRYLQYPYIDELHMVAPACPANFDVTMLNYMLRNGRIGRLFIYQGKNDVPVKVAGKSVIARKILGYGGLGRANELEMNIDPSIRDKVEIRQWEGGHSIFFQPENIDKFMWSVVEPDQKEA